MHWDDPVFADITDTLNKLGLSVCHVCGSETGLHADKRPVVLHVGGLGPPAPKDPQETVLYMVRVECTSCGHSQMFNSERFITGDTPALAPG
ncbi:MAG TPA: hypothetical protein VH061_07765 [Solirubrobacteraceae bacterium]|jgi:hypothetical protein|nr:hypothetical protein [Solirubrobacteraceae bacterium]